MTWLSGCYVGDINPRDSDIEGPSEVFGECFDTDLPARDLGEIYRRGKEVMLH